MAKLKNIVCSKDIILSFSSTVLVFLVLPKDINTEFVLELYGISLTVLSIIFSIFFAGSLIILSSVDDNFILLLEEIRGYSRLIWTFKYTLYLLFLSLLYSLSVFGIASYTVKVDKSIYHPKIFFTIFVFLFLYSLSSTLMSTLDAYRFSQERTRFLEIIKKKKTTE
jgi:hypothetical protein